MTTRIRLRTGSLVLGATLAVLLAVAWLPVGPGGATVRAVANDVLLDADFNVDAEGFTYQDDLFLGTSQPVYADGQRLAAGGYGGSGGLQVTLGGLDGATVNGMSGGWVRTFDLAQEAEGVLLSFRYQLSQSSSYEYDEYSRVLLDLDGTLYGRGAKAYVDHVGGTSASLVMTTRWQQFEVYLDTLAAGSHTLTIGGYNNKKNQSTEETEVLIDDLLITSGNPAPLPTGSQVLVDRLDIDQFKSWIQILSNFGDRCQMTDCTLTSFNNAQAWLDGELAAMGYTVERHYYTYNGTQRSNLYVTKAGTLHPDQMYMVSAHLDGRGLGGAANDDGSGCALVLEAARVFAAADVETDYTVRFIWWGNEESGLNGSSAYRSDRLSDPDEPEWLGLITHDMVLYDHGVGSPSTGQSPYADLDVEFRANTDYATESADLAYAWRLANGNHSQEYPANVGNNSTNTDDTPFHNYCPSISVRENRRGSGDEWICPYYHKTSDIYSNYSEDDFRLGLNAVQATVGVLAELSGVSIAVVNQPPVADPQSVATAEDTPLPITLTGSDPNLDLLTFHIDGDPEHGALSGAPPDVTYTPQPEYSGPDSFTFYVHDGTVPSEPAAVEITVTSVNDPPQALSRSAATPQDLPLPITLTASDPEGDPLSFALASTPGHGVLSGAPPNLTYTPEEGYTGDDAFTFTANDGLLDSPAAAVSIAVQPGTVVFADDFETDQGWTLNPAGADRAQRGAWARGVPQATDSNGPKQLGATVSGIQALVTGPRAGSHAGRHDVDGGLTSIRSPDISLPAGQDLTLAFYYYLAHGSDSSPSDYLRVTVVGSTSATVLDLRGTNQDVDAAWAGFSTSLNHFAGETVYLLVEAADAARGSLVEAALDDVSVVATGASSPFLAANFDGGPDGFEYQDDLFRSTNQPAYADGAHSPSGGRGGGGALQVNLGNVDSFIIHGLSGGWQRTFTLGAPAELTLSLWHKLSQSPDYERDEYSQVLVSLDGALYGTPPHDYVVQIAGNGNGGRAESSGWQWFSVSLGPLPVGDHTLAVGGYNYKKTYSNETTEVLVDDLLLEAK